MNFKLLHGAAVVGLLCFATACKKQAQQQEQPAPELAVMTVSPIETSIDTSYPTTLEGENDVEIRPQATGFLTKVCVQEGQKVHKGQLLFEIDRVQLEAQVNSAKAAVAVAQANVNTAATNANNNKMLLDKNIIGAPAYQTSADALNAAKASLAQAQANLANAQKALSYSNVTAPTSGVIGAIDIKEGSLVSPSTLLTILSNNSDIQAVFSITQNQLLAMSQNGSLSTSQVVKNFPPVRLELSNGEVYGHQGKVVSISGVLDPSTRSVTVKALFPNPDGFLHSGNTGKVLVPNDYSNVMLVPQNATYTQQDLRFVFVVNDSNKVVSKPIQISDIDDGKSFIVTEGLQPGERIVTEGVGISVKDGMTITPKK